MRANLHTIKKTNVYFKGFIRDIDLYLVKQIRTYMYTRCMSNIHQTVRNLSTVNDHDFPCQYYFSENDCSNNTYNFHFLSH